MDEISQKVKQWIDEKKDPRSAHWQGALEAILNLFSPYMKPGKLIPVQSLEKDDVSVFEAALEVVDLSPNLTAAFLPPSIAGPITPPESADELQRIDEGKPSYKILIIRPEKDPRILCAEISEHAKKPGIDIFESGALLGTYDYDTQEDCLTYLTQAIRAHIWEKGKWSQDEYKKYTMNWFEKILNLGKGTVRVHEDFSFFHSPTLIKSDRIDALFTLISEILLKRISDPDGQFKDAVSSIQKTEDKDLRATQTHDLAERAILELLNVMKELEIVKFDEFSNTENERFKKEFSKTILQITDRIS
ncbi:MAG: hypothetical protein SRB2_00582 [Desulfobacteraceae bacterium Eth-SRB2]|nr:MAG: hypothetical protein SRB2_00582 [Desulfobacteraceae bacterium Eth-SRB2]